MPNATDLAWAAGFFDGEGCIGIYKRHHAPESYAISLSVAQVDPRPLRRFAEIVGGPVAPSRARGNQRPYWRWALTNRRGADVLSVLYEYLVGKKEQAALALEFQGMIESDRSSGGRVLLTDADRARRREYAEQIAALKVAA